MNKSDIHFWRNTHTHTHTHTHINIYIYIYIYSIGLFFICILSIIIIIIIICACVYVYIYIYIYMNVCVYKYIYVCVCVCVAQSDEAVKYINYFSAKGEDSSNECPVYDTKQSDGEAPVMLELWGMHSTPSLPSLSGPLWPNVVTLDRVLSMGQTELFDIEIECVGFKRVLEGQGLRARLCCRKISDSIFWLYYFTPRWLAGAMPCPKKVQKKYTKRKIETDKRRKHFFHTFLYLLGEWTNQRYVPRRSVVPKTPDSKMVLLVWWTLPDKTRFTENLNIYLSSPASNSPLQNPSNFGATASHWLLYFLLFFFFSYFKPDWCVEPYAWRRVYTFCMWQPTRQHPVGSFIVNS